MKFTGFTFNSGVLKAFYVFQASVEYLMGRFPYGQTAMRTHHSRLLFVVTGIIRYPDI